ncbi:cytokinin hydroxylase-like [Vicia villosa]|uniref:cytokinin hydroxylase-like n=1 Tax=Vicia villosa TaxID=3911 RepID=UPI00273CB4B2|nr:cytokinin hydroxylase-like [Vicia villosa]
MMILTALLVILVTLLIKVFYDTISCYLLKPLSIKKTMEKQGVFCPKPRFLTGNLKEISSFVSNATSKDMESINHDIVGRLLPHFVAWSKQYGKRFFYWNGIEPRLCLTESELIKEFLSKYSTISGKSWQQQQGSKNFIGKGLLMANGDDWYHQRHLVSPAFMGEKLKSYAVHMTECTKEMLESLQNATLDCDKNEVEIGEYFTKLTADIISRTEFGTNYEKGKQIFHLLTQLQALCAQATRKLWFPGSRFFPNAYNREIKSLKMEVERLLMEIIQSRKDGVKMGRSNSYGNDLLGILLDEIEKSGSLNLQLVMDECKTFFFAGHDTTSLLLTWTVMLLATNPSWQEKVRIEVKEIFNQGMPSVDQLSKLNVLYMVINESMRLYPPATLLPRMAFQDIVLGDLYIPKGLSVWIPVLAIHHSEELWGKDANEFNPQRFASKSFMSGRFLPFASGPRNCVGQSFAMMEAKIILAMLVSRFSFTISENYKHAPITVLTIKPKYGMQICLKALDS